MKRWIRSSFGRAPGAPAQRAEARRPVPSGRGSVSEPLEGRVMMAAQLGASSMLGKFTGSKTAPPTQTQTPPAVVVPLSLVGPTGGLLEKDDHISVATSKKIEFSLDADISQPMDVDMYKFTVKKGDRVGFDIDCPAGSKLDSVLRLFNAAGQEIAVSDNDAEDFEPAVGTDSYIGYEFKNAGTYYIAVSGAGNDGYNAITGFGDAAAGTTGTYKLKAKRLPPPDDNDQIGEAKAVGVEDFITGNLDTKGDVDMYKFTVADGQTLAFDIEQDAVQWPAADTILRLFDADGNELKYSDNDPAPDEDGLSDYYGEAYIQYTFDHAGTYYIGVSGARVSNVDNGNGAYDPITGLGDKEGNQGHYGLRITSPDNYPA